MEGQTVSKTLESVSDIPRNNVAACIAYARKHKGVTPDEAHVMVMLQDDPTELLKVMAKWPSRSPDNDE